MRDWRWLGLIILVGGLARFYDLDSPWRRKDHYNFGGVVSSRMVKCYDQVPFHLSKGIPMADCEPGRPPAFYPNHPPTVILGQFGWSKIWGLSEASVRSFVIVFSLLNILLVYLIASALKLAAPVPLLSAAIQAILPGPLYFGSHSDFVCEFSVFWCLVATWFLVQKKIHRACLMTLFAGISSWLGFLSFGGVLAYRWIKKERVLPVFIWGTIAFAVGVAMMMWLQQTPDLREFLARKLGNPQYVPQTEHNLTYPLRWLYAALQYHNILLSPLFLLSLVLALFDLRSNSAGKNIFITAFAMSSAGWIDLIPGHQYFYIHSFDYMYMIPAYSLVIAVWWDRCRRGLVQLPTPKVIYFVAFLFLATYSYGRLQTNVWHDAINSLGLFATTVTLVLLLLKGKMQTHGLALLLLAGLFNISQMINWRNEPTRDYDFCKTARKQFETTGQPVASPLDDHFTRQYYCAGIPLIEPPPPK